MLDCKSFNDFFPVLTNMVYLQHPASFAAKISNSALKGSQTAALGGSCQLATFAIMRTEDDLQARWWKLEERLMARFGKKPDMEAILFLIGIQELDMPDMSFTKEQKQDLMHVAVCSLLSPSGYYELEGVDDDGWPHFKQLKEIPVMSLKEQEDFLRDHVLLYFTNNTFLN